MNSRFGPPLYLLYFFIHNVYYYFRPSRLDPENPPSSLSRTLLKFSGATNLWSIIVILTNKILVSSSLTLSSRYLLCHLIPSSDDSYNLQFRYKLLLSTSFLSPTITIFSFMSLSSFFFLRDTLRFPSSYRCISHVLFFHPVFPPPSPLVSLTL